MEIVFTFLAIIAVTRAGVVQDCSGIIIHGIKHEQEILKSGIDMPYQLAIDYDTNTLFFSYSTPNDKKDGFKSAYINLKTNEFGIIRGITGGFANTVDPKSHVVYLGGNDGIYTYNYNTGKAVHAGARDASIWELFYKDKLYYTDYPHEAAYTFEYGSSTRVPELKDIMVTLLAVDKHDNFVFSNSSGLFVYKKETKNIVNLGEYTLNSFASDIDGNLYFSTPDGIYSIDKNSASVTKMTTSDTISFYGLAIESDNNIIYADHDKIIRLKPTKFRCTVIENKDN